MKGHGVSTGRARQRHSPVNSNAGSDGAGEALPGSGSPYSDPNRRILRFPVYWRRVTLARAGTRSGWVLGAAFPSLLLLLLC